MVLKENCSERAAVLCIPEGLDPGFTLKKAWEFLFPVHCNVSLLFIEGVGAIERFLWSRNVYIK